MKKLFLLPVIVSFLFSCTQKTENKAAVNDQKLNVPAKTDQTVKASDGEAKNYKVKLSTKYGDMIIQLSDETPQHRDNFVKLVKQGYFDDLLFHRVIQNFMIQGGDPDSKGAPAGVMLGQGGPGYTVPAEFRADLYHQKGALAAARMGDAQNPSKASSGSQFYIVQGKKYSDAELNQIEQQTGLRFTDEQRKTYKEVGGTPFLDQNYTVFGQVIEGLDVIDKIAAVKTGAGDRPAEDVKMTVTMEDK